eukprot:TRINITY_DN23107_c0_g1_i1.p1 TRINITY_DN23107_c0_g1~~TRINITY_DN23107_c0_g1_i1.p1  ORF type:complete len:234 (+),score=28.80 TRINITY_DN23107_c0_g1_i1:72-773(+)
MEEPPVVTRRPRSESTPEMPISSRVVQPPVPTPPAPPSKPTASPLSSPSSSPVILPPSSTISIDPVSVVCSTAYLEGSVTVGAKTIIHPTCTILAKGGPIVIGSGNILEEHTIILNPMRDDRPDHTMVIGNNNLFEVGARIESVSVGNGNIFEIKSYCPPSSLIGDGCTIGVAVVLDQKEALENNTVVFGAGQTRHQPNNLEKNVTEIELKRISLAELLPKAHRLVRSASTST